MKRGKENVEQFVDEHLRLFNSPPPQQIAEAKERAHRRLASESVNAVEQELLELAAPRPSQRWRLGWIAAAAAIAVLVVMLMPRTRAFATVENADGGLHRVAGGITLRAGDTIKPGEAVRSNGGTWTVLKLADGSGIEMRSKSELWLEQASDGVRIHLSTGTVIVNAAKQRTGHLYVKTKDLTVSVVGTVFLVNAEEEGSRVAVIEGEVHVEQGAIKTNLRPGEQVSTSPSLEKQSVAEGIAWSREAPEHVAMLQQNQAQQIAAPAPVPAERHPVTMVVVLDRSGSMAGSKMDLAKEATKAPLALLGDKDFFGVLIFDYNFKWAQSIATVQNNKDVMRAAIDGVVATGNTNIYPALREAYQQLQSAPGETKHIILLSDGQTPAENFQFLASEMLKNKITVSTIAVTAASDRVLMENIASWGGGRAYYVDDPRNISQIFRDETELVVGTRKAASDSSAPDAKPAAGGGAPVLSAWTVLPDGTLHHSYAALYDSTQRVTLKGTLVSFEWANPHLFLTIAVENPDGSKTLWTGEGPPANNAARQGWTRAMLEEMRTRGEALSIYGSVARDGSSRIMADSVNGRSLSLVPSPPR